MKKIITVLALGCLIALTGCTQSERTTTGMVAGGVVGGAAGSALTGGSTLGTVAGAVGGVFAGRALAQ